MSDCGGLTKNGPYRLICLNTYSAGSGTLTGLEGLEKSVSLLVGFECLDQDVDVSPSPS